MIAVTVVVGIGTVAKRVVVALAVQTVALIAVPVSVEHVGGTGAVHDSRMLLLLLLLLRAVALWCSDATIWSGVNTVTVTMATIRDGHSDVSGWIARSRVAVSHWRIGEIGDIVARVDVILTISCFA